VTEGNNNAGKFSNSFLPTFGIDLKMKQVTVSNEKFSLLLWDTAGQERFKLITSAYYGGCNGVALVFDVNDLLSFEHVENWLAQVNAHAKVDVNKILIGNKIDLGDSRRVVPKARAEDLAKKIWNDLF